MKDLSGIGKSMHIEVDSIPLRRPARFRWPGPVGDACPPAPADHRQGRGDDLPGAHDQPQSLLHRGLPDHGDPQGP